MASSEFYDRISGISGIQNVEDWFAEHSMSYDDMEDMVILALNSDPDDIDFSKEFVYEYSVDENRYRKAYGQAIKCLDDYELEEMLDNGEIG